MEDKSSVMNGFEQFYTTQSIQISVSEFLINILLAAALGYILGLVYQKYSSVLSNRKAFSDNLKASLIQKESSFLDVENGEKSSRIFICFSVFAAKIEVTELALHGLTKSQHSL